MAIGIAQKLNNTEYTALQALALAQTRRVDFVMMGDSNQDHSGLGFTNGFTKAFANRFGLYATKIKMSESWGATSGSSSYQLERSLAFTDYPYIYVAGGNSVAGGNNNGITVGNTYNLINTNSNLRCHFVYSTFSTGTGSFQPGCRIDQDPYSTLQLGSVVNTNAGYENFTRGYYDLSAGTRNYPIGFRWAMPGDNIVGPFLGYYIRVEDLNKTNGVSCSVLYSVGGNSLYDMASQLNTYDNKNLINFFRELRHLQLVQNLKPIVVVYINSALNDRNETSTPSIGSIASNIADSAIAYADNLEAIITRLTNIWNSQNWGDGLYFLIVPSHPVSNPDDSELINYRTAAKQISDSRANCSFVDFTDITDADEMTSNSWYYSEGDKSHLSTAGYETLASRIVSLI